VSLLSITNYRPHEQIKFRLLLLLFSLSVIASSVPPQGNENGNAVGINAETVAAPATVCGEPEPQNHWDYPGKVGNG